jgi:uncharacterized membrane protein YdjX (TVP38/TMEM64 family)
MGQIIDLAINPLGLKRMQKYQRLILVAVFLVLLFAIFELSGLRGQFTLKYLQQVILDNKASGLLIFVLVFSLGNLVQIPGWVFLAAAALTLGKTMGGVATYVAACVSCVVTFLAIRFLGGSALRQLDNKFARRLLEHFDVHPIRSILILRILFQTVPALNYTLALSGARFRDYLIGTLLGLPVPIALYCLFFDYLARTLKII